MHNLRQTNHTYIKPLPFLGQKCSHIPLNLEVYLWEQLDMHIVSGENKQMSIPGYTTFLPGARMFPPLRGIVSLTPLSHTPENTCMLLPSLLLCPIPTSGPQPLH